MCTSSNITTVLKGRRTYLEADINLKNCSITSRSVLVVDLMLFPFKLYVIYSLDGDCRTIELVIAIPLEYFTRP